MPVVEDRVATGLVVVVLETREGLLGEVRHRPASHLTTRATREI